MRFKILGPLAVADEGEELHVGGMQQIVLAILLLDANRVVPVGRISEALWGENPPNTARNQIQIRVSQLRRLLDDTVQPFNFLITRAPGYLMRVEPGRLDLAEFDDLVCRAEREHPVQAVRTLGEALALWRGPALSGMESDLIRAIVHDLDERHLLALHRRIELELGLGRHQQLLGELRKLVQDHPLHERSHRFLMLALYRSGRQAAALDAFRAYRGLLLDALGLEPSDELRMLERAILNQEPALDVTTHVARLSPIPRQLPPMLSRLSGRDDEFVGRDGDLAMLKERLASGTGPAGGVAAIVGTAGVGKTALAIRFGHQVSHAFPDGQLYVNLRGYSPGPAMTPVEAMTRLLGSLGVPGEQIPADEEAAAGLYRSCLAGKRVLILLDNALSAQQVRLLLPAAPGCLTLVTSRSRLADLVAGNTAWWLPLDVLGQADARTLLRSIIGADRAAAEPEAVAELARLCARLPLALRVAAANVAIHPHRSVADYVAALAADRLSSLEVDGESAVRAAFTQSYVRLGTAAQRLFRLLGLVPGPDVTAEAAAALSGTDTARAARLLDQLAAAHLIEEHRPRRYVFHDLLRRHARSQAEQDDDPPSRREATERLGSWYVSTAARAIEVAYPATTRLPAVRTVAGLSGIEPVGPGDASAWLAAECENLVATAVHAAEHGPYRFAWLLGDVLRHYFVPRAGLADWAAVSDAALRAAIADDEPLGQAAAQLSLAMISRLRSRYDEAIEIAEAAAALCRRSGWPEGAAVAHNNLAAVHVERGEMRQALTNLRAVPPIYRAAGMPLSEAAAVGNLGAVHLQLGALREAQEHIRTTAALRRPLGKGLSGIELSNLATVRRLLGHLDDALGHATDGLARNRERGFQMEAAKSLAVLAQVHRDAGRLDLALDQALRSRRLAQEAGNVYALCGALNTVGTVHTCRRAYRQALDVHQDALTRARAADMRYMIVRAMIGLGRAHLGLGHHDEALLQATRSLEIADDAGYRIQAGNALTTLAEIHRARLDHALSTRYARQALAVHGETGFRLGAERTTALLAAAPARVQAQAGHSGTNTPD